MNTMRKAARSLTLAIVCAGLGLLTACGADEAAQGPPPQGPAPVTVAAVPSEAIVEWDRYTGRLEPVDAVDVRARVSGYLQRIHFDEGQIVEEGQLLFTIDPRPFEAALAEALAGVKEGEAGAALAKAGQTEAQGRLAEAEARLGLAQGQLERAAKAASTNAIAREQVEVRRSEVAQAQALVDAATGAKEAAAAQVEAADAAIATAKARVATAELNLNYTTVRASIAGRIGQRLVARGNLVDGGGPTATLLTTIVSIDPIHVYFTANEREFLKYARLSRQGTRESSREARNPVYMKLANEEGYPHFGQMDFVANRLAQGSSTITGRAIFRNPEGVLTPGLFATLRLAGSGRYEAVLVPDEAVATDQARRFVYVVDAEDKAQQRFVELGPLARGLRVVKSGLEAGERIVIKGLQRVRPGAAILPQPGTIEPRGEEALLPTEYSPVPRENWIRMPGSSSERGDGGQGR